MWQSVRLSHTILRFGLAIVFLSFGISKFMQPSYWLLTWIPPVLIYLATMLHLTSNSLVYCFAVFDIFVAISLASNMFVDVFAFVAAVILFAVGLSHGLTQAFVSDIGLAAGLLALVFWPSKQSWKY